jgi:hypothetical protein
MTRWQPTAQTLGSPERSDLPYFAYGLFKPGELAYGQIESLVNGESVKRWVSVAPMYRLERGPVPEWRAAVRLPQDVPRRLGG